MYHFLSFIVLGTDYNMNIQVLQSVLIQKQQRIPRFCLLPDFCTLQNQIMHLWPTILQWY